MGKEIDAIRGIVQAINECWKLKDYDGIGSYLADDVVIAPPHSDQRVRGRAAYLQSYRDYDQMAEHTRIDIFSRQLENCMENDES